MGNRRRRFCAWAMSDFLLALLLILLCALTDEGRTTRPSPQDVLTLSADATRVQWKGLWFDVAAFDPKVLAGAPRVGLVVPPEAPAAQVVAFQFVLQDVVQEVLYARDP